MSQGIERSRGAKIAVFLAAVIAWSHDAVGLTITNFVAKPIMAEFGVGKDLMGFVFSAQYIATIFGAILFGELADRLGRKMALFLSVAWDAILTAVTAFAPNFLTLAILRILSGVGVSWGIGYALLSEELSHKRRGFYGGLLQATFIIGYLISAFTVKEVFPHYGWRPCFLIALYPIPLILILEKFLPESRVWQEYKRLEEIGEVEEIKVRVKELFTKRFIKLTIIASLVFWAAEMAYHALVDWAPTMLQEVFGYTTEGASALIMEVSLVAIIILPMVGLISDYIGRRLAFSLSALGGFLGTLILAYYTVKTFNPDIALIGLFIIPLGFGSHALYGVWLSEMYPTYIRATATSFIFSVARGFSLGAFIVGLLTTHTNLSLALTMTALGGAFFIIMSLLAWLLPETKRKVIRVEEEVKELKKKG